MPIAAHAFKRRALQAQSIICLERDLRERRRAIAARAHGRRRRRVRGSYWIWSSPHPRSRRGNLSQCRLFPDVDVRISEGM